MKLNIIEEKENPLFGRKEVKVEVENNILLSQAEAEKLISEKFSVKPECLKIKKIESKFGSRVFVIIAHIYATKENKDKVEVKTKQEIEAEKKAIEEATKARAEAKAAEAKVSEEPKENTEKTEEKTE